MVAYMGVTHRSRVAVVQDNLSHAAKTMELFNLKNRYYPPSLPDDFQPADGVAIEVIHSPYPTYSSLSTVQSGVLFYQVCQDLINEGKGKAENLGGGIDTYITSCNVYNNDEIQIHGWDSPSFTTPLSEATLTNYIASVPAGDAWHPNQQATIQTFFTELRDRYKTQGGSYPITSFWDSWATSTNGGIQQQPLPAPDDTSATKFCVQATHIQDSSIVWHTTQGNRLQAGPCP